MSDSAKILGKISLFDLCHLRSTVKASDSETAVGLFLVYGSWNDKSFEPDALMTKIQMLAAECMEGAVAVGYAQVDETEDSLATCLGDNDALHCMGPCPPSVLPALVVIYQDSSMDHSVSEFVEDIAPLELLQLQQRDSVVPKEWCGKVRDALISLRRAQISTIKGSASNTTQAIRIFVAGDRSSVGKSSVSLGILGSLLKLGYPPQSLAYIKPATQCEAPQLVQAYCDKMGIECVPVGPIVYYKGFTRAFLAGETESTNELLAKASEAVDELAQGKRVMLMDGVGFPSVGSICGTDNASVARACGYPAASGSDANRTPPAVLIVGGSGVGAAVDAYNLNSTYFRMRSIPVMGAVFNKLSLDGFYSLENCRREVSSYFDQHAASSGRAFGFVPLSPGIAGDSPMDHVEDFIKMFQDHVDVKGIVEAAARQLPSATKRQQQVSTIATESRPVKRIKRNAPAVRPALSRQDIERKAKAAGAAPSA